MRILYCIPTLEYGGAERQLSYLALRLKMKGHQIHVAFLREGANLERLKAGGVASHRIGSSGNYDPQILFELVRLIRELRPDVVQTTLMQMDVLGGAAAVLTRTPWVLRESSAAPSYPAGWKSKLRVALAGRAAAAIVAISAAGDAYWRSKGVRCPRCVIPNGIPLDEIAEARPAAGAADLAFAPDERVVLYAGRMDAGKNVENLIVALSRIADEVPFTALLCGDGPLRARLERLVAGLGLGRRIVFTGNVANVWALMKRADAFAFFSKFEGGPNVVMEAMACGCPLVVSDIPSHREMLDERSARFAHPDDPAGMSEAVKATLLFGGAARARAGVARVRAAEWTVEGMAERYEQVYLRVIDRSHTSIPSEPTGPDY